MSVSAYFTRLKEHADYWTGNYPYVQRTGGIDLDPYTLWGFHPVTNNGRA